MNKIFAFHGSDHKVGTTQLAHCCAEYIARKFPQLSVLLVLADGGRGSEYCCKLQESLDCVRPYLSQSIVDCDEIKAKSKYKDNLYILGGNDSPQSSELFSPDCAEYLLEKLKDSFDFIIVDSGSDIDMGCCLGSLFAADRIFMVLNQRESALRSYEWKCKVYEQLEISPDLFIINLYNYKSPYEPEYISDRLMLDPKKMLNIRVCRGGNKSESDGKSLMSMKPTRPFLSDIERLSEDIILYAGIEN